jgi:hypothetical protein
MGCLGAKPVLAPYIYGLALHDVATVCTGAEQKRGSCERFDVPFMGADWLGLDGIIFAKLCEPLFLICELCADMHPFLNLYLCHRLTSSV